MAETPEGRLAALGIELPAPPVPKGAYIPVVVEDRQAWVAGMLPLRGGELAATGLVDGDVDVPLAKEAARWATLNGLAALRAELGSLDRIRRVLQVRIFVASSTGFIRHSEVGNGASELLLSVFGDAGKHARATVGVVRLPLNAPVEVEMHVAVQ